MKRILAGTIAVLMLTGCSTAPVIKDVAHKVTLSYLEDMRDKGKITQAQLDFVKGIMEPETKNSETETAASTATATATEGTETK